MMQSQLQFSQEEKKKNELAFEEELKKLNAEQRRAVEHIEGPVMVIAGPGTGKTQIIAARIGNILKSDTQAAPHNILCLTYTDAGTVAMRNRLLDFIGPTAYRVNIYTFHAFCNDIIQHNPEYFGSRELEPVSELETVQLLRELLNNLPPEHLLKKLKGDIYSDINRLRDLFRKMKEEDWQPEFIDRNIDEYLNDLPNREEYIYKRANAKQGIKVGDLKQKDIDAEKEKMEKLRAAALLFPQYQQMMKERGRYDYSDMLLWVLDAFTRDENFLRNYQERYQYFLVDEYQDTSGAQNELLTKLIDFWDKPNVFVVGDDDQCIYEFQGARVKNMIQLFEKYENEMEVIVLKENYRSTQLILDISKNLIDHNHQRLVNQQPLLKKIPNLTKTLIAGGRDGLPSVPTPSIVQYHNVMHEEASIVEEIERLKQEGVNLKEVAVLYFRHRQAENIISSLEKKGIPYNVKNRINILELPVIRQIITILKYLQEESKSPNRGEHLLFEIMHYRFFKISPRDIAKIFAYRGTVQYGPNRKTLREILFNQLDLQQLNLENPKAVAHFEQFITERIREASNLTLPMLMEKVLNQSGMLKGILDAHEKIWMLQVVTTFFDFVKEETAKRPRLGIGHLLEMLEQMSETKIPLSVNKTVFEENGVNFITCHSAKGLEFRYVYVIGCTVDNWEKSRARSNNFSLPDTLTFAENEEQNKLESSRRLFYVAMTRAKEHLQISFAAKTNEGKDLEKSVFVAEISEKSGLKAEKKHLPDEKLAAFTAQLLTEQEPPRIDLMDKNFLNSILENYKLSPSDLSLYLDCPLSFYYNRILRIPAAKVESLAFGNAVHKTLFRFFDKMRKSPTQQFPGKEEFVADFRKAMEKEKDGLTDVQFINRKNLGEKILPEYYDRYVHAWNKIVLLEYTIDNIEVDGVPLKGRIDKLEFTGKEVNVVDYKTGNYEYAKEKLQTPSDKNNNGGDYWRQIVFYKILMDNMRGKDWKMISGEFEFVEKDKKSNAFKKEKVLVGKADIATVKNQIREVYSKIMNHEFSVGCGKEDCDWCNFVKGNKEVLPVENASSEE